VENNIEEAIKIMEHWIEYEKNNKEKINRADELINIQETILSAYKRVLKEKNRLEEQVEYDKTHIYTPQTIKLNFISKSKIKDKIEQLKEKEESDLRCYGFAVDTHLALQTLQELLDGNDTNVGSIGNSIEEEIETLEELRTHGYAMLLMKYEDRIKTNRKIDQALEHIVSDYKKVLKENEILKEEKEQAWEEWNNLEQGSYGTEQKLKQQIKELRKENEELIYARNWYFEHTVGKICTPEMLDKILRNDYIPKSKLKDIIDRIDYDIKKTKEIISKNTNINASYRKNDYQIVRLRAMNTKSLDIKNRLQKLLESEE
jgi:hypothetical protein